MGASSSLAGSGGAPPDPASDEEAPIDGNSYAWDLRFTDEGGETGSYDVPGNRQGFAISIP